ncbi:MAG: class I SAM-dependent methyltransferase [Acetobacter peroxydans]|uniref:class I SAM-dependent methyltransferase n=2 Tax=Acetobacter peroxydans TaxID=104098 RepID=UPI002352F708|nr:class I SAM-dependent methyltransferase [Acetobacter peroxydans]MCH4143144.1 class I SAM-dependent methyltransferase [Acetobacter peroxydans]MCI1411611.1 class I SAM-dependent methyltransferase [Acetobacter peroxydans]MCI1440139.1 class I SAM-dependent methyltransferase [Acetobacter peroxydans]MCI1566929.1 class I SAM-dependent methyltransferase [Acetobacter peroxydans]MCI1766902.1 class I SAM-dependent methyltransferase [Acetobacter peroxydans]
MNVLDIGGSLVFWLSVPEITRNKCSIHTLNLPGVLENLPPEEESLRERVNMITGDARDLSMFADQSFDIVICNSVIEHVGNWLADPLQVCIIRLFRPAFKAMSVDDQYMAVYHTRPLTRAQFSALLPDTDRLSERLLFPKSHVAIW